jgi:excisionase family DNA binding protein
MASPRQNDLIMPTEQDAELALQLLASLKEEKVHLQTESGATFLLPPKALDILKDLLKQIAKGNAVSITPVNAELSTHQAAEFLNVSRPYLIKLLEQNQIPYHKVGSHRRIPLQALREYKTKEDEKANLALDEMVSISQKLGLYDVR